MKKKNIGVNALLNVIKSGLSVIFPLITYPYALRKLGADAVGKVSYGDSIVSYFSLIAMLGIATYAVREGVRKKHDRSQFTQFASEMFTINVTAMIAAYLLLIAAVVLVRPLHAYSRLIMLQSISIALTVVGVDWINTIFEDFLFTTVRGIAAHIVSLVLLFVMVKGPDDFYLYALLSITTNAITCITNWIYCRRYAHIRLTRHPNFRAHMKPILILFVNALAISIYVNSDTTMLGWIKGDHAVGLYTVAVRVYTIVKSIMAAIYAVAIPRLAYLIGQADTAGYRKLYSDLWCVLSILLLPTMTGLICLSDEAMYYMGGAEYLPAASTLQILAVAMLFAIFGGLVTSCLNVTLGRERENLQATVLGAALNCGLNLILIPLMAQNGAAITTVLAEVIVLGICFVRIPQKEIYFDFRRIGRALLHAGIGSLVIAGYAFCIKQLTVHMLYRIVWIVPGSVLLYGILLLVLRDEYAVQALQQLKRKLGRTHE